MAQRPLLSGAAVKQGAALLALADRLGHPFAQPDLLRMALTHPSMSSPTRPDNQRLEFLGDRVLGLVMAEALYSADATASEGQLAPRYNALVRKEACAAVARDLGLGDALKLGRSEMLSGGRRKDAILADAMEAVIAAIYLDAGFEAARAAVLRLWGSRIAGVAEDARDAKTSLQEWAQARSQTPPDYAEVARSGPDHAPEFTVEVRLESGESASATAGSKRQAEQRAARSLLDRLTGADQSAR
jgi:ribonuclease-3